MFGPCSMPLPKSARVRVSTLTPTAPSACTACLTGSVASSPTGKRKSKSSARLNGEGTANPPFFFAYFKDFSCVSSLPAYSLSYELDQLGCRQLGNHRRGRNVFRVRCFQLGKGFR